MRAWVLDAGLAEASPGKEEVVEAVEGRDCGDGSCLFME